MTIYLIERARENLLNQRTPRLEEPPQNQVQLDQLIKNMRRDAEDLLDLYGQTTMPFPRWQVYHPWILGVALFERVTPIEILERRKLNLTLEDIEPPVTVTLSHAGRKAAKSWFITAEVVGSGENLHLFRDKAEIYPNSETGGYPLRRANLQDIQNYREVIDLFKQRFPI